MYEIRWIQKSKRVKRNSEELHSKNTTELFYNISNLKPDSEYLIRVAALTKAGTGPFTADLYSKTDEAGRFQMFISFEDWKVISLNV